LVADNRLENVMMTAKRDYNPFERINDRWPTAGDRVFVCGRDAWPANSASERAYRLGKGYKLAGDTLVANVMGEPRDHDNLIYPILFCYRHYIEISLKELIQKHGPWVGVALDNVDHKLSRLWELFLKIAIAYGNDPSDNAAVAVGSCVGEFAEIDPTSVAFRYARNKRTGELLQLSFGSIDLVNVLDVMNGIANFFECAELEFDHRRDAACELWEAVEE
jgi:hypothetical protein